MADSIAEVLPRRSILFRMASLIADATLGYRTEDCLTLRLEMGIRCSDNEAATFVILRKILTRKGTVSCEVRVEKPYQTPRVDDACGTSDVRWR